MQITKFQPNKVKAYENYITFIFTSPDSFKIAHNGIDFSIDTFSQKSIEFTVNRKTLVNTNAQQFILFVSEKTTETLDIKVNILMLVTQFRKTLKDYITKLDVETKKFIAEYSSPKSGTKTLTLQPETIIEKLSHTLLEAEKIQLLHAIDKALDQNDQTLFFELTEKLKSYERTV